MIGFIGVGKIEIVCCLVCLVNVLFIKVEVIKFIEVGYVGCDVELIICDFVDVVVKMFCEQEIQKVKYCVEDVVEECIFDVLLLVVCFVMGFGDELVCEDSNICQLFCKCLCEGQLDDKEIDIEVVDNLVGVEIMVLFGMEEMINQLQNLFFGMSKGKKKICKLKVVEVLKLICDEEVVCLVNEEEFKVCVLEVVEQYGIVFIDEIDKIVKCVNVGGVDVFCEGVQCDLLLLIEGCMVNIKLGMVKIDYILFIVFGVFYLSKLSDLVFELQGCLLICVEFKVFSLNDFECIFIELYVLFIEQYCELLKIEGLVIEFVEDGIKCFVEIVWQVNEKIENIGVCCLYMLFEWLLEEVLFSVVDLVSEYSDKLILIDVGYVNSYFGELVEDEDLFCYIF